MQLLNVEKYLNLTDTEVIGLLNGNCRQIMRQAKAIGVYSQGQIIPEQEIFGPIGTVIGGREAWRVKAVCSESQSVEIEYHAGGSILFQRHEYEVYKRLVDDSKWNLPQHMHKFSTRLFFRVKALHVHRLMSLSEDDAQKLGIDKYPARDTYFSWYRCEYGKTNFQSNDWQIRAEIEFIPNINHA